MIRFVSGNRVSLLEDGSEFFPALEAAIAAARREIYIETYIFRPDAVGSRIADALAQAAGRGVTVHLLLDGFGSQELGAGGLEALRARGIQAMYYRPERSAPRASRYRLHRLHRKLAVVDGRVAFVGGINLHEDVDSPATPVPRLDFAVQVEGPVVSAAEGAVRRLWLRTAWAQLRKPLQRPRPAPPAPCGRQVAALALRDNLRNRRSIETAYLQAVTEAREEILIASAYFFPGPGFRRALQAAARRGVRVVLLLQGRLEYPLLLHAARRLYRQLLAAGIEIHEYQPSYLHAKVAVVDGRWATVGSSNIDPLSLLLAREANLLVADHVFAGELRERVFEAMRLGAVPVGQESLARAERGSRLRQWTSYLLVRLLTGAVAYPWDTGEH